MQRWLMLSLLVILVSQTSFSQQTKTKKDRFPSYFGLTAAPVFGSDFIGSKSTSFQDTALLSTTKFTLPGGKYLLQMEGRRVERTHFASGAGIGFEFRTKKAGTFYFGGSAKIPFRPIFLGVGFVKKSGSSNDLISVGRVNGSYFTLEARYYLPTLKAKGEQFKPGPVEQ
ncbi:MAG: hypothetical protein HYZ43_15850 [Flavobacteriia bacterium]|nr:hypothetical protein [Flavobacteriia bacterium]